MKDVARFVGMGVLWLGFILSLLVALVLGYASYSLGKLTYNSEGRYFDSESAVVYHDQAVGAYFIVALGFACLCFLFAASLAFIKWRVWKKRKPSLA